MHMEKDWNVHLSLFEVTLGYYWREMQYATVHFWL